MFLFKIYEYSYSFLDFINWLFLSSIMGHRNPKSQFEWANLSPDWLFHVQAVTDISGPYVYRWKQNEFL